MKIYVASSWRNEHQPQVVRELREAGFEVYDFREKRGPRWGEGPSWGATEFRPGLLTLEATEKFWLDMDALITSDAGVLVLPSGRSAHLEAGHLIGASRPLVIYIPEGVTIEPELMYRMATAVCGTISEVIKILNYQCE